MVYPLPTTLSPSTVRLCVPVCVNGNCTDGVCVCPSGYVGRDCSGEFVCVYVCVCACVCVHAHVHTAKTKLLF